MCSTQYAVRSQRTCPRSEAGVVRNALPCAPERSLLTLPLATGADAALKHVVELGGVAPLLEALQAPTGETRLLALEILGRLAPNGTCAFCRRKALCVHGRRLRGAVRGASRQLGCLRNGHAACPYQSACLQRGEGCGVADSSGAAGGRKELIAAGAVQRARSTCELLATGAEAERCHELLEMLRGALGDE